MEKKHLITQSEQTLLDEPSLLRSLWVRTTSPVSSCNTILLDQDSAPRFHMQQSKDQSEIDGCFPPSTGRTKVGINESAIVNPYSAAYSDLCHGRQSKINIDFEFLSYVVIPQAEILSHFSAGKVIDSVTSEESAFHSTGSPLILTE